MEPVPPGFPAGLLTLDSSLSGLFPAASIHPPFPAFLGSAHRLPLSDLLLCFAGVYPDATLQESVQDMGSGSLAFTKTFILSSRLPTVFVQNSGGISPVSPDLQIAGMLSRASPKGTAVYRVLDLAGPPSPRVSQEKAK